VEATSGGDGVARHSGPITAVRCIWVIELTVSATARDRGLE
jgi:hypothetical protein